jgi:hypothetical protein
MGQILQELKVRACLKNHSRNLHAPLCGIFYPNSVAVARYGALIRTKSPTNCDTHLAESLFQTRSKPKKGADFPNTEDLLLLTESSESPASITNICLTQMRIRNIRLTVYKCDHLFFLILQAHAV